MSVLAQPARVKTLDLAYIALMAALMAICAWISLPVTAVPFTLQTLGVFLALGLLGGRRGTAAIFVYLLLGLVGLPVFAGFTGGIGRLLGVTGGYLLGFLLTGLVYWGLTARLGSGFKVMLAALALGLAVCYAFGSLWYCAVYVAGGETVTLAGVLGLCVVPYLLPDGVKLLLALLLCRRLGQYIKK